MDQEYRTSDLYFAAFLACAKCQFVGTAREEKKVFFKFAKSEFIEELKTEYFSGRGQISAMDYANQIKSLKSLVYA